LRRKNEVSGCADLIAAVSWTPKTEGERTAKTPQVAFGAASMLLNEVEGAVGSQGLSLDEIVLTMGGLQRRRQLRGSTYDRPRPTQAMAPGFPMTRLQCGR
jgi:hypothetical protein